ncbi:Bug family tripartite tricarboxylate transporter substrate binding protein [Natribacillus halophilus]|uniref:Bug family tripartite tricarboxylate transporter substrate binding protein n=1 Tax=Natribacillus halophilus TaxID=549003 RepID=UPI001C40B926|nr:tripartite tricarboxylate transporter substrate binding protein [Natribacillus halophilus]
MKKSLISLVSGLIVLAGCGDETTDSAEEYPTENIDLLVGAGPGGGTDNFARATEDQLSDKLETNIVIENLEQASGAVANEETANSAPDGHTINYVSSTFIVSNAAGQNDTGLDELTPVARMQSDILSLVVNPDEFDNFEEFREYAEANEVNVGGTHAVSPDEMGFLELQNESDIDNMNYVPYDDTGEVQAAVMGGNLDAYVGVISAVEEYMESGDLEPVLVFSEERLDEMSDIPATVEDYGWDITNGNERGVLVHADTPPEILDELENVLNEIFESDEYKEYEEQNSLHYRDGWMSSEEYEQKLEEDYEMYQELLENQ